MALFGKIELRLFAVYFDGILLRIVPTFVPLLRPFAARVKASCLIMLRGFTVVAVCGVIVAVPLAIVLHWLG